MKERLNAEATMMLVGLPEGAGRGRARGQCCWVRDDGDLRHRHTKVLAWKVLCCRLAPAARTNVERH